MKSSRCLILFTLMFTITALAVFIPGNLPVQAAPPGQSAEDRIIATMEEANQILGGGFEWGISDEPWTSETVEAYFIVRPSSQDYLLIKSVSESFCLRRGWWDSWTFHGMDGCISGGDGGAVENAWEPEDTLALNGYPLIFSAASNGGRQGTKALAEALHQAALNNGLYGSADEDNLPANPTDTYSDPPDDFTADVPEDDDATPDYNTPADIPLGIILGSLGVPITGAVIGAVLSAIMSGTATAGGTTAGPSSGQAPPPRIGSETKDGLVWSERPWDEAGPGYVPKEDYLRTKDFLEKGYRWKDGGWQTPEQIEQIEEWDLNDRRAVDQKDAEWRAEQDKKRQELHENREDLARKQADLDQRQFEIDFLDLKSDFKKINKDMLENNIYVQNPYQGDPTVLFHRLNTVKNMIWDNTVGHFTGDRGLTCEGYVNHTKEKVYQAVTDRLPGSTVQRVIFEEKSSKRPKKNLSNWLDSRIDDNHILFKVTLKDGSEWALDFHQFNAGNSDLLQPWPNTTQAWHEDYMGDEFLERIYHTWQAKPE
jgi:hypothetical protein